MPAFRPFSDSDGTKPLVNLHLETPLQQRLHSPQSVSHQNIASTHWRVFDPSDTLPTGQQVEL